MAARVLRGAVVGRVRAPRRQTQWLASADISGATTLATGAAILDQSFTQAQIQALGPLTIVRTRGEFWVTSDQASANETPFGAVGFMIVREQARAAGIASLPTPITEEFDDGFFVHQFFLSGVEAFSGVGFDMQRFTRYSFDSKAQRKVSADDSIVVTVENASAVGLIYVLKFRMLVKLS